MKQFIAILLAFSMIWTLSACGSSAAAPSSVSQIASAQSSAESIASDLDNASQEPESYTVDMIYFKNLGGGSIMAACYTDEGVALLGADYYVVHVADAEIYDTQGDEITLEELTRGSKIQIQWPGMVMESYPGQIAAEKVTVLSDEIPEDFPAEDAIPPICDGPIWWEEATATEAPNLILDYSTDLALVTVAIQPQNSQWSYSENGAAGANNTALSGQPVQEWTFDDNNTIKRTGFDTITLSANPAPDAFMVTVFAYGDDTDQGTTLELDAEGTLALLDGNYIYLVEAKWDNETYTGQAVYAFLVLEEETP